MIEDNTDAQASEQGSMADFVAEHRRSRLPRVARQDELVQRQRNALYGLDEQRLREWRGDYQGRK
jgi:hypothetical protein